MADPVIREPARDIPVLDSADVLVAGGGISGCAAALSAARAGAKTILLERNGFLGGVATATMMASIGNFLILADGRQIVHGFAAELIDRLVVDGSAAPGWRECKAIPFDSERLKILLIDMLEESGVTILAHATAAQPIVEDGVVRGAFIESKSGRLAVPANNTVDATGELDVIFRAGGDCVSHLGNCSLLFKMTGCDLDRFVEFLGDDPEGFPARRDRVKDYEHLARMWREHGVLLFPHYGGKDWRFLQKAIQRGEFEPKIPPAYNLDVMGMYALRSTGHVIINSTYYIFQSLDIRELSRFELHAQRMCYYVGYFRGSRMRESNRSASIWVCAAQEL